MSRYTSDQSLAEGLHAGRRDAFERLYADQHAAVYNLCARMLGDRQEAEDVTQDTFVTAFGKPPAASSDLKLRPWLYRVATNACFNRLRARKHAGGDGELVAAVPDQVDEYQRAETVALVEASLAGMNERYRAALVLKDLHGLAPAEIAEVMEVSRPAADVLVHRARGAFKTAFAKLDGTTPAPASLGLLLAPLSVPAVLHAMPPLPHPAAPAVPHHVIPHAAGPTGAGLLGKIGASLAAKVAIGGAATAAVIGGGVAVVRHEERSVGEARTIRAATPQSIQKGTFVSQPVQLLKTRWGCFEWHNRHDLRQIEQWCTDHATSEHRSEPGRHASEGANHDSAEHSRTTDGAPAVDDGSSTETTHAASSGPNPGSRGSGGSSHTSGKDTTTHDGDGDGGHGGGTDH